VLAVTAQFRDLTGVLAVLAAIPTIFPAFGNLAFAGSVRTLLKVHMRDLLKELYACPRDL
jgi:hypothetical protein